MTRLFWPFALPVYAAVCCVVFLVLSFQDEEPHIRYTLWFLSALYLFQVAVSAPAAVRVMKER